MKRILCAALALMLGAVLLSAGPVGATNIGNEGCTPGYWKNHPDNWQEYKPDDPLSAMFAFPALASDFADDSMMDALNYGGGPGYDGAARILLRATVAAFLNAAHEGVGYPYRRFDDPGNLAQLVYDALASGNRATMLSVATMLDNANNLGTCPLNNEVWTAPTLPPPS